MLLLLAGIHTVYKLVRIMCLHIACLELGSHFKLPYQSLFISCKRQVYNGLDILTFMTTQIVEQIGVDLGAIENVSNWAPYTSHSRR